MRLTGRFEYLGLNEFQGKKDPTKKYFSASLLHGMEVLKVFLQDGQDTLFTGLKKMDVLDVELDVRIGQTTYINVASVTPVEYVAPGKKAV